MFLRKYREALLKNNLVEAYLWKKSIAKMEEEDGPELLCYWCKNQKRKGKKGRGRIIYDRWFCGYKCYEGMHRSGGR